MGQHGYDPVHQINAGAPLSCLPVKGASLLHIMAHIGDMDTQDIMPLPVPAYGHRVIQVLGILAVNGHGVGNGGLRRGGHAGGEHIVIGSAPLVNILGGSQDAVANVQLGAGESRGHLQVGDVPVWQ